MRALVIGADGFVGRWLVRHLVEAGDHVEGVVGPRFRPPLEGAEAAHAVDVRDYEKVRDAVEASAPDAVYYLAAVSTAAGRERVEDAARIGLVGAIHTLTACASRGRPTRIVHVSSSHVYGAGDAPLTEDSPVAPTSVYGAAKLASERALLALASAAAVEVVVARPFNHIGPGQAPGFVVPSLAAQVRAARSRGSGTVTVGDLDAVRDFTDVRDVVRAYRVLATEATAGRIFNVASGVGTSVRELVTMMIDLAGVDVEVEVDPAMARADERRVMVGDASRLESLGWQRTWSIRETLTEVIREPNRPLGRA